MSMSNLRLHRWPLAALAVACGSAMGAQINADLAEAVRRDGRAEPSLRWLRRQCTDQELMDAVAANFLLLSHAWSTRHRHATIRA